MSTTPSRMLHGCLLAHPGWFATVADLFVPKDFSDAVDKQLWATFAELHEAGKDIAPLDALVALESVEGGSESLASLSSLMRLCEHETPASFKRRIDELITTKIQTQTKRGIQKLAAGFEAKPDHDWAATLELFALKLRGFDRRKTHFTPLTFDRFVSTASGQRRKVVIPTGFAAIDKRVVGFVVAQTMLFLARTNAGKSSFLAALARNQFVAGAAQNIDRAREANRSVDPYTTRCEAGNARHPEDPKIGERPPFVLILSVEDDVDDYLTRFICDLCDVRGKDFLKDPEHAVYASGKGERLKQIAHTFTEGGRLTIADYEADDGEEDDASIDAIEKTILGWKRTVEAPFLERGEEPPPLLVLMDYFQMIEIPEEESKATPEYRLLAKISQRLRRLSKRQRFALGMAVMLLRGPDDAEPDGNETRGGSNVIQDAEVALTIWPFGPGERAALAELKPDDNVQELHPASDTFEDAVSPLQAVDEEFDEDVEFFGAPEPDAIDKHTIRRALNEIVIKGAKGRGVEAGWETALEFDRDYKRITNAFDAGKVYRRDPNIQSVLRDRKKTQGKSKR